MHPDNCHPNKIVLNLFLIHSKKLTQSFKRHKNSWHFMCLLSLACFSLSFTVSSPSWTACYRHWGLRLNLYRTDFQKCSLWLTPENATQLKYIYFNLSFFGGGGLLKVYLLWTWVCEVVMLSVANSCSTLNYRKNDLTSTVTLPLVATVVHNSSFTCSKTLLNFVVSPVVARKPQNDNSN